MRHAATALNDPADPKLRGTIDAPLDEAGLSALYAAARSLVGEGIERIVTSDLNRARDTAEAVRCVLGLKRIWPSYSLRPWQYGELAGMSYKEGMPLLRYFTYHAHETPPGGEPNELFLERWGAALQQLLDAALTGPRTLAVVHSRNLYAIPRILFDADRIPLKGAPEASAIVTLTHGARGWKLEPFFTPKK
jgi:broad specificity phosphatase PhoE